MPERTFAPTLERSKLAYDIQLDINDYHTLASLRPKISHEEFIRKKAQLDQLKTHNLQTNLGERFNTEVFQINYHLKNGQLFNTDHDEPFVEIIKRGRQFREDHGSQEVKREKAELTGFAKVQETLNDPDFEGNIIVISPKGPPDSIYQHNFFDVYSRNEDGTLTMSRYNCQFTYKKFNIAAKKIDPFNNLPQNPKDSDFLENPLITYKGLEEIQEILHKQEETLPLTHYHKLLEACTPLITAYINVLNEGSDYIQTARIYNSILNFADNFVFKPTTRSMLLESVSSPQLLHRTVDYFARQPIRQVSTGCGIQTGFNSATYTSGLTFSPYSVAEFGFPSNSCPDCSQSENHFHCPGCNGQISSGQGITTCPHCGLTKEQAGSKCG